MSTQHIFPIETLTRRDREELLSQRAAMIWFTGLSGSGKSTLALEVERRLHSKGLLCRVLDGDNIRSGINKNLGFSVEDRLENIRRIAEVSKLFVDSGIITIAAFISPTDEIRTLARNIIGAPDFIEIFVDTPIEVCESRDIKGLYQKARRGEISDFTGVTSPFEPPKEADLTIDTSTESVEKSVDKIMDLILKRVSYK